MGVSQGCCVCLPIHINKAKADNAKNFAKTKAEMEK